MLARMGTEEVSTCSRKMHRRGSVLSLGRSFIRRNSVWSLLVILAVACGGRSRNSDRDHDDSGSETSDSEGGQRPENGSGGDKSVATGGNASGGVGAASGTGGAASGTGGAASGTGGAAGGTGGEGPSSGGDTSSGGTSGELVLPLHDDCEVIDTTSFNENRCVMTTSCSRASNWVVCDKLPSGDWQCGCEFYNSDREFLINGAEGLNACAVATNLCALDELQVGEEECHEDGEYTNPNFCNVDLVCSRPVTVDFASGVDAKLMDPTTTDCYRDWSDAPFKCTCSTTANSKYYSIDVDSGAEACSALAKYCHGEPELNPGPAMCERTDSDADADMCALYQNCTSTLATYDGVEVMDLDPRGAACHRSSATTSSCYCTGINSKFTFEVELEPRSSSCEVTSSYCSNDAVFEATGEASCAPTSQTAGVDWCEANLDCAQPATANGDPIVAGGRLGVYCRQEGPNLPWWCSCASNQESVIFEYGGPTQTGWAVCVAAPASCLELMPVHLGVYGEYMSPPDPLPKSN